MVQALLKPFGQEMQLSLFNSLVMTRKEKGNSQKERYNKFIISSYTIRTML